MDVLGTVPLNAKTEYKVELFLKPTFGNSNGRGNYWTVGGAPRPGPHPNVEQLMCYSTGVVVPPEIPNQVDEASMIVWEVYRMETEVLVVPRTHDTGKIENVHQFGGVEGPQLYFWAVGGEPLDVLGIKPRHSSQYPTGVKAPTADTDVYDNSVIRAKVDGNKYPIECWIADPSRNDNTKYFGRMVGGIQTPPVVTYSNSSTIPVLDEYGIGVLCLQGKCYLTSADMLGLVAEINTDANANYKRTIAAPGRFFRLHFRQRRVKNPYTINLLYKQVFSQSETPFEGQKDVLEVTMTQEEGPSPSIISGTVGTVGNQVTDLLRRDVIVSTPQTLPNTQQH